YVYWQLVAGWHWPILIAALFVVFVLAPVFGAVIELVLIRRVRGQPLATTLVVTIGLMVLLIGVANAIWKGQSKVAPSFFGRSGWHLTSKVFISWHETLTILIALGIAGALRLLLYGTRVGIAMRAVVDNRDLAALNGARPAWIGTLSWALGAGLASLAGILIAPILNDLSVLPLTLLVVYAYGAAMLGRLRNLPLTFVGALLLGLGYSYSTGYIPQGGFWTSTPIQGLRLSLPVVMLFVVLLVMRQDTIEGGRLALRRQAVAIPSLRKSAVGGVALVVAVAISVSLLSAGNVVNLGIGLAFGLIMLSLVPLTGWGGQVSLCQMTFAGLGAFAMARVGHGSALGLLAALGLAGIVGALIALPALRLRGLYLALATMAFAVAMDNMFFPTSVAFTFDGVVHIARPGLFGLHANSDKSFVIVLAVIFAVLSMLLLALRRGPFGRLLLATKDSEAACATLGMSLTTTKLAVFALSAAIAGLAGALFGAMQTVAGSTDFNAIGSLPILLLVVVGGVSTTSGALIGGLSYGLVLPLVQNAIPWLASFAFIATGLAGVTLGSSPDGASVRISQELRRRLAFLDAGTRELDDTMHGGGGDPVHATSASGAEQPAAEVMAPAVRTTVLAGDG
ncbi:MAG: branched-chain amino acid ABC transporter permease, partial [Acidimicrobiales bacterium]